MSSSYDVLVTGSAGHLGTALMLSLPSLGFKPLGIDILSSPTTTLVGSVSDRDFIASIFDPYPIRHVLHAATLHKPHVCSHSKEQFISTNIVGTLILLEESSRFRAQIESFIFFSTTSTFGMALSPKPGHPAAWIDESVVPVPKSCGRGYVRTDAEAKWNARFGSPHYVKTTMKTVARPWPMRTSKVLELAYRRCDLDDIVSASVCAMGRAKDILWGKYIISAPPPFNNDIQTLNALNRNPAEVLRKEFPELDIVFEEKGWKHLARIDRVYDSSWAVKDLGWNPKYTFEKTVQRLVRGEQWKSDLTVKRNYLQP
ncbi:unnamed protein product [Penicillium viridicatum]